MGARGRSAWLAAVAVAACFGWAAQADAYVYWTNQGTGTAIGRANLDGTGANQSFMTGAINPTGVAVDAGHIYWTNVFTFSGSIGRANLDGTGANQSFISGTNDPEGVAVDAGHVYWTNLFANGHTIGRANLDGTGADQSFITGAVGPFGVAVDAGHVYWANSGPSTIGRANLDGTGADQSFITGAGFPQGVAVDGGSPGISVNAPPRVAGLRVQRLIRADRSLPQVTRKRRSATIRFKLSEDATVRLSSARRFRGGRVRRVRTSVTMMGSKGLNRVRFHGRLSKRRSLKPGSYRLTVVARDDDGARSSPKRARFRLLSP